MDNITLDPQNTKYDPINVLINSDDSNKSDLSDFKDVTAPEAQSLADTTNIIAATNITRQTKVRNNNDIFDKLCNPYIRNKLTQVVRQNKSMMAKLKKLEEVNVDLWESHDSPS